jgi:Holliday junction resolvase RusA-like endonuclease
MQTSKSCTSISRISTTRLAKSSTSFIEQKVNVIYDEYQQVKRDIDRLLKQKGRVPKAQLQADYNAAAPMQDMFAQITVNDACLSPVQPSPAPVKYAFEERARIARVFFDPPSSAKYRSAVIWSRCAPARSGVLENPVERGRMIL